MFNDYIFGRDKLHRVPFAVLGCSQWLLV